MSWSDRDVNALAGPPPDKKKKLLHFSGAEIKGMRTLCTSSSAAISRHGALLATVWTLINRARQLNDAGAVYFDIIIGFRQNLNPAPPETFVGKLHQYCGALLAALNPPGRRGYANKFQERFEML